MKQKELLQAVKQVLQEETKLLHEKVDDIQKELYDMHEKLNIITIKQNNINRKTEEMVYSQISLEYKVKRGYSQLSEELEELLDMLELPAQIEGVEK